MKPYAVKVFRNVLTVQIRAEIFVRLINIF